MISMPISLRMPTDAPDDHALDDPEEQGVNNDELEYTIGDIISQMCKRLDALDVLLTHDLPSHLVLHSTVPEYCVTRTLSAQLDRRFISRCYLPSAFPTFQSRRESCCGEARGSDWDSDCAKGFSGAVDGLGSTDESGSEAEGVATKSPGCTRVRGAKLCCTYCSKTWHRTCLPGNASGKRVTVANEKDGSFDFTCPCCVQDQDAAMHPDACAPFPDLVRMLVGWLRFIDDFLPLLSHVAYVFADLAFQRGSATVIGLLEGRV